MLGTVYKQLLRMKGAYIQDLEEIETLPKVFDNFLVGYQEDIQNKLRAIVDDISNEAGRFKKARSLNDENIIAEIDIIISLITYLFYYKVPLLPNISGVDMKQAAKQVTSFHKYLLSKLKDFPLRTQKVFTNCYRVLDSYNVNTLEHSYEIIFEILNSIQEDSDKLLEMTLTVVNSIAHLPFLLKVIKEKKHATNNKIIDFVLSLICKFIEEIKPEDKLDIKCSTEEKMFVENYCNIVRSLPNTASRKAYILISFIYLHDTVDSFTLSYNLTIFNLYPKFFISHATDDQIEQLIKCMLELDLNVKIEEDQKNAFIEAIIAILIIRPNRFSEVISRIRSCSIGSEYLPKIVKEIYARDILSQVHLQTKEKPKKEEDKPIEEHEDDGCEMEDLGNEEENQPLKVMRVNINKIKNFILELSSRLLFSSKTDEWQLLILEALTYCPEDLRQLALKSITLVDNLIKTDLKTEDREERSLMISEFAFSSQSDDSDVIEPESESESNSITFSDSISDYNSFSDTEEPSTEIQKHYPKEEVSAQPEEKEKEEPKVEEQIENIPKTNEQEDLKEIEEENTTIHTVFFTICGRLREIVTSILRNKVTIPESLPNVVSLLLKFRETIQPISEIDIEINAETEEFLRFLSLLSLFDQKKNDDADILKCLGYKEKTVNEALNAIAASDEMEDWKARVKELMEHRFEIVLFNLGIRRDSHYPCPRIDGLTEDDFKSSTLGYFIFPKVDTCEATTKDFISMLLYPPIYYAVRILSDALKFLNVSELLDTTNKIFNEFFKSLEPAVSDFEDQCKPRDASMFSISILKNSCWDKDLMVEADFKEIVVRFLDYLTKDNIYSPEIIRFFEQLINTDKENTLGDQIKAQILESLILYQENTMKCPVDSTRIIIKLLQSLDFNLVYNNYEIGTKVHSLVLNIFDYVDKCIKKQGILPTDSFIELFNSICSFYSHGFSIGMSKLFSNDQQIVDTYLIIISHFLETYEGNILIEPQAGILDVFRIEQKEVIDTIGKHIKGEKVIKFLSKCIDSVDFATDFIAYLLHIHFEYFEKKQGKVDSSVMFRGSSYSIMILYSYMRLAAEQWLKDYYQSGICRKIIDQEGKEISHDDKIELIHTFIDYFNGFIETIPHTILKIVYSFSEMAIDGENKKNGFQSSIFLRVFCPFFFASPSKIIHKLGNLIMKANSTKTCKESPDADESSYELNVQQILDELGISKEDYHDIVGIVARLSNALFKRAKDIYEKEGFNDMWYNKKPPTNISTDFMSQMCAVAGELCEKEYLSKDEEESIQKLLDYMYQISIEYNYDLPAKWNEQNTDPRLKVLFESCMRANNSPTAKMINDIPFFRTSDEKKWLFVIHNLINASIAKVDHKEVYIQIVKDVIEKFGIKCDYQIPVLRENFSGRVDSLAIRISKGLAACNSDKADLFLKAFFEVSKMLNDSGSLLTVVMLLPWASVAGKSNNDRYIQKVIDAFIANYPNMDLPEKWARSASAITDIISSFAKARKQTPEEILSRELAIACTHCLPEDEKKVVIISKMLILFDNAECLYNPSILHSCIIGSAFYDIPSIRNLLIATLRNITGMDQNRLQFVETSGSAAAFNIANMLLDNRKELEAVKTAVKDLFLEDIKSSPIHQISIVGWMFTVIFSEYSEIMKEEDSNIDHDYLMMYSDSGDFVYNRSQVEEFVKNAKKYSFSQRLLRLSITHPKELNDILLLYFKKNIDTPALVDTAASFSYEKSVGDLAASLTLGIASVGKISFKEIENESLSSITLLSLIYLITSRSDKLSEFISEATREGKIVEFIKGISEISSIGDVNLKGFKAEEFIDFAQKNGTLDFVVNKLIELASNKKGIFKKSSNDILISFFNNPKIWIVAKKSLPMALLNIYSAIVHQKENTDFTELVQTILNWKIEDGTPYLYESLMVLDHISQILKHGSIQKLASQFKVYNKKENTLDYDEIFSRIAETPVSEISGVIFAFCPRHISESKINKLIIMFTSWINSNASLPVIGEIFSETQFINAKMLTENGIQTYFQLEAIACAAKSRKLDENDASYVISKLNSWVSEKAISSWCKLALELVESKHLEQKGLIVHLQSFIDRIMSIKGNITLQNVIQNIKNSASKLNEQILKFQENEALSGAVSNIDNDNIIFINAKSLVGLLSGWNVDSQTVPNASQIIKDIIDEINLNISHYNRFASLSESISESCEYISKLFDLINVKKPKTLSDELFLRSFANKVLSFILMTETEFPGFNPMIMYPVLFNMIKAKPDIFIPTLYAASNRFTQFLKESFAVISHQFVNQKFTPFKPMLAQFLEVNNFEKLFNGTFEIEEVLSMINYLASTRMFDDLMTVADEKLSAISSLSDNKPLVTFFSAAFCFLLRPLYFSRNIIETLKEGNINDVFYQAGFSEGFYLYFNKFSASNNIKKSLIVECFLKPLLKNPEMYLSRPNLTGYCYDDLDFNFVKDLNAFFESVQKKRALVATCKYVRAKESRLAVVRALQKAGKLESVYSSENEEEQFAIDFRVASEFSIFTKLATLDPVACLSFFQMPNQIKEPLVVNINGPSPEVFFEQNIISFWRYAGLIQTENEANRLCHFALTRYPHPKVVRELVSFIIMKFPQCSVKTLIEVLLESTFRRSIGSIQILRKNGQNRIINQMRYVKLLYQLSQLFPGIFNEYGPLLIANSILSMVSAPSKWVKYVRGLISSYAETVAIKDDEQRQKFEEKKNVLLKSLCEKERLLDVIAQSAFEVFDAIGKGKEFASLFNSLNRFDYEIIFPSGVAFAIKYNELEIISSNELGNSEKINEMINSIIRTIGYYIDPRDGSWTCYLSSIIEVLLKLVKLPCSIDSVKLLAWMSIACIISQHNDIRVASLNLLRACIEKLALNGAISKDVFLSSCMLHMKLISVNDDFHKLLTRENKRNFLSLFSVCISIALGYGDPETEAIANEVVKAAWNTWKTQKVASLYILLPMAAYATFDIKEFTGRTFQEILDALIPSLEEIDFMIIRAYIRSASKDRRCPRERFSILCPNGYFPLEKDASFGSNDDVLRVYMPSPANCDHFFFQMIYAMEHACSA